ncbi:hypothetical protein RHECNPAF_77009 [Rhizobium etli CNPAF512]|nr:hypothetical protein RHECNPAF_77009 [Rhizobium etli CNPAF512]
MPVTAAKRREGQAYSPRDGLFVRVVQFKSGLLHRRGLVLVEIFPVLVRHAVDHFARFVLRHRNALGFGSFAVPVRQAVAAEAGEIHQIDVLHVAALLKMRDEAAEGGGFEFSLLFFAERGHLAFLPSIGTGARQMDVVFVQGRIGVHRRKDRRQAFGPCSNPDLVCDQILAHFEQRVRDAGHHAVPVHGIALQGAVIGLVVANDEIRIGAQHVEQRADGAPVAVPEDCGMPGAGNSFPRRREGMQRQDQRRPAGGVRHLIDRCRHGMVIGAMEGPDTILPLLRCDRMIARDDGAVGNPHDQRRVIFTAVRVDQQAREAAKHRGYAESRRELPRQALDADVIGDVAGKGRIGQAEPAISRGEAVHRVIGEDHHAFVMFAG